MGERWRENVLSKKATYVDGWRVGCSPGRGVRRSFPVLTQLVFRRTELFILSVGRKAVDKTCGWRLRSCAISLFDSSEEHSR